MPVPDQNKYSSTLMRLRCVSAGMKGAARMQENRYLPRSVISSRAMVFTSSSWE
jgi:hypothetical protein